jgi:flagellar basal-body rod modification protein FlgD
MYWTDEGSFMQIFPNTIAKAATGPVRPEDSGSTSGTDSSSSSTNTATVSANDFLQLLVSELKNQDPTADTDPNEYINQLVQVNSLEQLISINQDLAPLSSSTGSTGSGTPSDQVAVPGQGSGTVAPQSNVAATAAGNLSAPNSGNSASRIATSLETAAQTLAPGSSGSSFDSVLSSMRARAQQARTSTSNPVR